MATSIANYETLKKAVDDAKTAYDTQNALVNQLTGKVGALEASLKTAEEGSLKYDVTYYESLLAD